jgi:Putative methyltransferase
LLALAHQYRNQPQFCLVGAEIHNPGIGVVCQRVQQAIEGNALGSDSNDTADESPSCSNGSGYWSGYTLYSKSLDPFEGDSPIASSIRSSFNVRNPTTCPPPYSNLRVHAGDGFKLLSKLPTNTLSAILITFPDPFPKEGEEQWRLIQVETLEQFHRVLRKRAGKYQAVADETFVPSLSPNGRFYLATDHFGYFRWVHNTMAGLNAEEVHFRLLEPCPDRMSWLPAISMYEQRGWDEGRRTHLACWEACKIL